MTAATSNIHINVFDTLNPNLTSSYPKVVTAVPYTVFPFAGAGVCSKDLRPTLDPSGPDVSNPVGWRPEIGPDPEFLLTMGPDPEFGPDPGFLLTMGPDPELGPDPGGLLGKGPDPDLNEPVVVVVEGMSNILASSPDLVTSPPV